MIVLTGDTHGEFNRFSNSKLKLQCDPIADISHIIILGDAALIWDPIQTPTEKYWLDWFAEKPYEILAVKGNHENHERINRLPMVEKYGAPLYKVTDNVYYFEHGYKYTINNKSFFIFGGADSIDKEQRKYRVTWWEEEIPSAANFRTGVQTCEDNNYTFDYVLTHTAPLSAIKKLENYSERFKDPTVTALDFFENKMKCCLWCFGHFHESRHFVSKGINFSALYYDFIKLETD